MLKKKAIFYKPSLSSGTALWTTAVATSKDTRSKIARRAAKSINFVALLAAIFSILISEKEDNFCWRKQKSRVKITVGSVGLRTHIYKCRSMRTLLTLLYGENNRLIQKDVVAGPGKIYNLVDACQVYQ